MEVGIDRHADSDVDGKSLAFAVIVRSINNHTHGSLTRADKDAIRAALVTAANVIEPIIRKAEQ